MHKEFLFFALLISVSVMSSCGRSDESVESNLNGGSFSQDYGGSFYRLSLEKLQQARTSQARVIKIGKPVGLGINHYFIVIELDGLGSYSAGLVAKDDMAFYRKNANETTFESIEINGQKRILMLKHLINDYLNRSYYRYDILYVAGMVSTPLLGRPCKKVADRIYALASKVSLEQE